MRRPVCAADRANFPPPERMGPTLALLAALLSGALGDVERSGKEGPELDALRWQRDAALAEWDTEETAHIRAIEQLREHSRHTEWERASTEHLPTEASARTPPARTTIESLIQAGLDAAQTSPPPRTRASLPPAERHPRGDPDRQELAAAASSASSGDGDDDGGNTSVGLIAIAVLPGAVGVLVIVTMVVLAVNGAYRARIRHVEEQLRRELGRPPTPAPPPLLHVHQPNIVQASLPRSSWAGRQSSYGPHVQ